MPLDGLLSPHPPSAPVLRHPVLTGWTNTPCCGSWGLESSISNAPYLGNVRGLELSSGCRGRQASSEVPRLLLRKSQKVETLFELGGSLAQAWSWEEPGASLLTLSLPPCQAGKTKARGRCSQLSVILPELGLTINQHSSSRLSPRPEIRGLGQRGLVPLSLWRPVPSHAGRGSTYLSS